MRLRTAVLLAIAALATGTARAEVPTVVASIKPVHSLVASVMAGIGEPTLLVKGGASPHTYSLRPSDASELDAADLVFWVGEDLEPFLAKPLDTLAEGARIVELSGVDGLVRLPYREGGVFERHEHASAHASGTHEGEADDEEAHDHEAHGHEAHDHEAQDHEVHGEHAADAFDMHLWLDPRNAAAWLGAIEAALSEADPDNRDRYRENAAAARERLAALEAELSEALAPVRGRHFLVFHDAYHYFEDRFGIEAAGSITVSPEVAPGARRVAEIRERIAALGAVCVFAEPQFEPRIVETVIEGSEARAGVLDPEGAGIDDGPELYFTLMRNIAASLRDCLTEAG